MIDAVDLPLVELLAQLAVELAGAGEVRAERLLDDDARPAALRARLALTAGRRETGRPEVADDLGVEVRRHREIEEPVPGGAAVPIDPLEELGELLVRRCVVELALVIHDAADERLPDRVLRGPVAAVGVNALAQVLAELLVAEGPARETHDGELGRQEAAQLEVVERGSELALGEIAGRAEDHHGAGLRHLLEPQPLAQRIIERARRPPGQGAGAIGRQRRLGGDRGLRDRWRAHPASCVVSVGVAAAFTACPPNCLRRAAMTRSA